MSRILFFVFLLTACVSLRADDLPSPSEATATVKPHKRSTICLNMIVKNEAHVIERCLESVLPLIDCWVICDTGSTDGTQELIKRFFQSRNIPGEVIERPWVDFAHNRNEALALGKEFKIDGKKTDYLLFMDADDILSFPTEYTKPQLLDKEAYYIRIFYSGVTYDRVQLIKASFPWEWVGVVHEVIYCDQPFSFSYLDNVVMQIVGGGGRSKDPDKFLKDAAALEADLEIHPNNTRSLFYLAQSYRDAGQFEKAIEWYQKRAEQGGWNEEVFWSLYQIAQLEERLNYDLETLLASYSKAFMCRPSRSEPLYRAGVLQRLHNNPYQALSLVELALKMHKPRDLIFVEDWVYEFGILFEYSICSLQIGRIQESFNACLELLGKPDLPNDFRKAVEHNLAVLIQLINQPNGSKAA